MNILEIAESCHRADFTAEGQRPYGCDTICHHDQYYMTNGSMAIVLFANRPRVKVIDRKTMTKKQVAITQEVYDAILGRFDTIVRKRLRVDAKGPKSANLHPYSLKRRKPQS